MAIQNRRGVYNDFDPSKLVAGEWAVVQSGDPNSTRGQSVYMAFSPGDVKRMATYEDMEDNIDAATSSIQSTLTSNVTSFLTDAESTVNGLEGDVSSAISDAQTAVGAMQTTVSNAVSNANTRMSAIESDYAVLEDANADQLVNMQGQITNAIANTVSASNTALQSAATANEVAEEIRRIIDEGGTVVSVFGRSGEVVSQSGDYSSSQIAHGSGSVEDALVFDSTPTAGSTRAVQSGGVYSQLYNINHDMLVADDENAPTDPVDFESSDDTLNPTSSVAVELLSTSDIWATRLNKISKMFKNIRYLLGAVSELNSKSIIAVPFSTTISDIAADGSGNVTVNVSVPSGYTAIGASCAQTSIMNRFIVWVGAVTNTSVRIMYLNARTSAISVNVSGLVFARKT